MGPGAKRIGEAPSDSHCEDVAAHGASAWSDGPIEGTSNCLVGDEKCEEQEFRTAKVTEEEVEPVGLLSEGAEGQQEI